MCDCKVNELALQKWKISLFFFTENMNKALYISVKRKSLERKELYIKISF